jgi:hemerythrin
VSDAVGALASAGDVALGYAPMDAIHGEFLVLLQTLLTASDEAMAEALAQVHAHSQSHFAEEERWMDDTAFPPRACHADEHAAVLASMEGVARRVAAGDFEAGRRLARALAEWFPGHAHHLDSALAHWLCKRQFGGKPVVLHRPQRTLAQPA